MKMAEMTGPILIHRGDILASLKSLYAARPDWYECLQAVAIQADVVNEFDKFVAVQVAILAAMK